MDIKPIETYYNGYRFRSKLEARWAVFFDALEIEYEYEPDGFKIGELGYLPDFYLPKLKTFVEIKRYGDFEITYDGNVVASEQGKEKYLEFAAWCTKNNKLFLIAFGDPVDVFFSKEHGGHSSGHLFFESECTPHILLKYYPDVDMECDSGRDCKTCFDYRRMASAKSFFIMHFEDGHAWCAVTGDSITPSENIDDTIFSCERICEQENEELKRVFADGLAKTAQAAFKARQARFERGETPQIRRV